MVGHGENSNMDDALIIDVSYAARTTLLKGMTCRHGTAHANMDDALIINDSLGQTATHLQR